MTDCLPSRTLLRISRWVRSAVGENALSGTTEGRTEPHHRLQRCSLLSSKPSVQRPRLKSHSAAQRSSSPVSKLDHRLLKKGRPVLPGGPGQSSLNRDHAVDDRRPLRAPVAAVADFAAVSVGAECMSAVVASSQAWLSGYRWLMSTTVQASINQSAVMDRTSRDDPQRPPELPVRSIIAPQPVRIRKIGFVGPAQATWTPSRNASQQRMAIGSKQPFPRLERQGLEVPPTCPAIERIGEGSRVASQPVDRQRIGCVEPRVAPGRNRRVDRGEHTPNEITRLDVVLHCQADKIASQRLLKRRAKSCRHQSVEGGGNA